jgi:hypothetical protein
VVVGEHWTGFFLVAKPAVTIASDFCQHFCLELSRALVQTLG